MSIEGLLEKAWGAREFAHPWKSGTKVGCALETNLGVSLGWNIEGLWMTSIHAEVSAVARLRPGERIRNIAIVAKTKFFTPCGACFDWLVQFAEPNCTIVIQGNDKQIHKFQLRELYPLYPKQ